MPVGVWQAGFSRLSLTEDSLIAIDTLISLSQISSSESSVSFLPSRLYLVREIPVCFWISQTFGLMEGSWKDAEVMNLRRWNPAHIRANELPAYWLLFTGYPECFFRMTRGAFAIGTLLRGKAFSAAKLCLRLQIAFILLLMFFQAALPKPVLRNQRCPWGYCCLPYARSFW